MANNNCKEAAMNATVNKMKNRKIVNKSVHSRINPIAPNVLDGVLGETRKHSAPAWHGEFLMKDTSNTVDDNSSRPASFFSNSGTTQPGSNNS